MADEVDSLKLKERLNLLLGLPWDVSGSLAAMLDARYSFPFVLSATPFVFDSSTLVAVVAFGAVDEE